VKIKVIIILMALLSTFSTAIAKEDKRKRELRVHKQSRSFQKTHNRRELRKGIKRVMKKRFRRPQESKRFAKFKKFLSLKNRDSRQSGLSDERKTGLDRAKEVAKGKGLDRAIEVQDKRSED